MFLRCVFVLSCTYLTSLQSVYIHRIRLEPALEILLGFISINVIYDSIAILHMLDVYEAHASRPPSVIHT